MFTPNKLNVLPPGYPASSWKLVSAREWVWILIVSMLILLFSTLPYLAGFYSQTSELVFGGAVFDRMDYAVHMATMHMGYRGEWTYQFRFTSEPHSGAYVKLFYVFLGHLARWLDLSLEVTYHLARWVFGLTALLVIYHFLAEVFDEVIIRKVSFLVAVLGSGLGWFQFVLGWQPSQGISPIDFWLMDAYVFFSLSVFPHYMAVLSLIVVMILFYLRYIQSGGSWNWILPTIAGLAIVAVQPFSLALGILGMSGAVAGKWIQKRFMQWSDIWPLLIVIALQLPLLIYNFYVFGYLPVWSEIADQHIMLSPPPLYYLFGFGLIWPFAIWGGVLAWRRHLSTGLLAIIWVTGALLLCYLPFDFQRRFIFGLTIPLGLLAGYGVKDGVFPRLSDRTTSFSILLISIVSISSIYLSLGSTIYMLQRPRGYFEPGSLTSAIVWLNKHSSDKDVVLASETTSQLIAAETGLAVYSGHPMETLNYDQKREWVNSILSSVEDSQIPSDAIRWIISGPYEHEIREGGGWKPSGNFQEVYKNEEVSIYRSSP